MYYLCQFHHFNILHYVQAFEDQFFFVNVVAEAHCWKKSWGLSLWLTLLPDQLETGKRFNIRSFVIRGKKQVEGDRAAEACSLLTGAPIKFLPLPISYHNRSVTYQEDL